MALDEIVEMHKKPYRGGGRREEADRDKDRDRREYRDYRPGRPRAPRDPREDKRKVLVENLHFKTSWQDLKDHMRSAGTVERADILTDREGRSTGRGYGRDLC